jgi:hypothetical protein
MANENQQNTFDARLLIQTPLPAANASVTSASINLNAVTAGRIPRVEVDIQVPATPALTNTDTITLTLMDSADNVTFAAIPVYEPFVITGATGNPGGLAFDIRLKLNLLVRQYLALQATVSAGGGSNIAVSTQLALVF